MKIYERDFVDIRYRRSINPFISVTTNWSWSDLMELFNNSDFKLIDRESIGEYTSNKPSHVTLDDTGFPKHQAFTASVGIAARPWLKFRIRNGQKREIESSSPIISLDYRKGFSGLLGSDVDYDLIEAP